MLSIEKVSKPMFWICSSTPATSAETFARYPHIAILPAIAALKDELAKSHE